MLKTKRLSTLFPLYTSRPVFLQFLSFLLPTRRCLHQEPSKSHQTCDDFTTSLYRNESSGLTDLEALKVQHLLKLHTYKQTNEIERCLADCGISLTQDLVLNVLRRHRSDGKPAYAFFNWVVSNAEASSNGYSPVTAEYNEMLDILGRNKRFEELNKVVDEMLKRNVVINERTYGIVVNRFAAGHMIDEAIEFFYKRKELGLKLDLIAFQTLLMSLCRYKHVEAAEFLFHNKKKEFEDDIKTWNIVLNGWCVQGKLREAKRFWNDIVTSKCRPDKFTYGIFINSLSKAGKISTAVKLFQAMWEKGCKPDVAICNTIIDGLCFKKRIPEALEIFREMNERECSPDVATYNTLIKHLCKIRRMQIVYELLDAMEEKRGDCMPNARTYGYLLNAATKPDEVYEIMERMERKGCRMLGDTYNLLLRLFVEWDVQDQVKKTWAEMERSGLGPDQRSYTIMVHGSYYKGRLDEAMQYVEEMIAKGMSLEQRTKILLDAMRLKLKERRNMLQNNDANLKKRSAK